MLICTDCGARSPDDERFCTACGAYLTWSGARAPAGPAEHGTPDAGVLGGERAREQRAGPNGAGPNGAVRDGVVREDDARPDGPGPDTTEPDSTAADRTAPDSTAPDSTVDAVLPAARRRAGARPRRPAGPPAQDRPLPGDLVCGACGTGNVVTRRYCRRCAGDLVDARVAPPDPWWWRLLRRRRPRHVPAGSRPTRRRRRFPVRTFVVLLALAGLAATAWWRQDDLRSAQVLVRDGVLGNHAVTPSATTASSAAPDRGPELAVDGATNRSWAPATPGPGTGEHLEAAFDEPFRLVYLRVFSGASEQQPEFLAQGRVEDLTVTVQRSDGSRAEHAVRLLDRSGGQEFRIGEDDVVGVRLTVGSAHPVPAGAHVALGEVEFLGRD